jgi:hypothetical protein
MLDLSPANAENEKYIPDIEMMLSFHVETVVLMCASSEAGKC